MGAGREWGWTVFGKLDFVDSPGWRTRTLPLWSIGAVLIAIVVSFAIWVYVQLRFWTPLERWYFHEYMAAETFPTGHADFWLITKYDRNGHHSLATDTDVVEVPYPRATTRHPFELSETARQRGATQLVVERVHSSGEQMSQLLAGPIFAGQSKNDLERPAFVGALVFLVVELIFTIPKDRARHRRRVQARRLKGPELVTVKQFNRWSGADGISFLTTEKKFLTTKKKRSLSIPRSLESSHIIIMGDTGSGKSVLQRRILTQVAERGETAIVYDPALEYTPQFFNPARGDLILNPLDARCPYWSPADEVLHEAEALTLAASLFPDKPHENTFFVEGPRKIFAHLLTLKPSPEELVRWMSHEEELDRLLKGTELEAFVYRGAGPQRGGVLGALNMVADCLKLLPRESDANERWTTEAWARQKSGWLFLTSIPRFRGRLLPLTSLWLDTLVLRLMNQGNPGMRHAWFVLDELASLQRLPQLHTALTENRKSGNPVVIGFQGRSQLEVRYGHEAETMLSQPATKIFLHTREPRAAKWISESIGDVQMERLKKSIYTEPTLLQRTTSLGWHVETRTEPLVLASQISGLERLHAFLKVGNKVVPFSFPYTEPLKSQPGFVPRASAPRVVEMGTRAQEPTETPVQQISQPGVGESPKDIAAGQGHFFS